MFLGRRVSLAYPEGLPVSIDQVNVDPVKLPKKKRESLFLSQSLEIGPENVSEATAVDRSSLVKSSLDP